MQMFIITLCYKYKKSLDSDIYWYLQQLEEYKTLAKEENYLYIEYTYPTQSSSYCKENNYNR